MEQYIPKSALVAEIEKRKKEAESNCGGYKSYDEHHCDNCTVGFYEEFLEILDTLQVKKVGLEKELERLDSLLYDLDGVAIKGATSYLTVEDVKDIAKHFFELELKTRKGE